MKVLVLSNSFIGLYSFRREVFQALRDNGYEVTIACPIDSSEKAKWFDEIGCSIINQTFNRQGKNPFADFKLMMQYLKIIKQVKPMVVLSYTIKPNLFGGMACALSGIPQIANITGLGAAVENPGLLQKLTIFLYRFGMRKTDLIFFQNEENRQFCLSHNMLARGEAYTKLIPGSGVNLHYHSMQAFPSEKEPIRFIFVSRIRKEKGIDEYLAAAEFFHKQNTIHKTEWHVLGYCEGDYKDRLKCLHDSGIIIYHGLQSDVRPFNAKVHCGIHPTYYPEGMSNVLLEYCAAGRAIITTNRAGCREIIDDGINGFIVKQQDSADLITVVHRYLNLSYEAKKAMGEAARKKVEQEFDRQIVVNAYLDAVGRLRR